MDTPSSYEADAVKVGKIPFTVSSLASAANQIIQAGLNSQPLSIRLSNAYCVALAAHDSDYAAVLNDGGVNFPDGTPVVWFMNKKLNHVRAQRVRGPSLFNQTLKQSRNGNVKHFFLGTTSDTLEKLVNKSVQSHPNLGISGSYSPPFAPLSESFYQDCANEINSTDAQIVWIALGTPKQDFVASELAARTGRPCVAVGAAFDFSAGTVREAPELLQNSGLEWAYRLATDPRRLWRRYLIGNFQFLVSAVRGLRH